MPESLLTILKFLFLALVWLFFARVLRAVWAELAPEGGEPAPGPGAAPVVGGRGSVGHLKVVEPAEQRGQAFDLGDELTMGRAGGCQIALEHDKAVSQLHARVFRRDGRVYVEDLGSTNGTYLNAKKVTAPAALHRGDRLQVGRTVLEATK
jgi:hypothetical protein